MTIGDLVDGGGVNVGENKEVGPEADGGVGEGVVSLVGRRVGADAGFNVGSEPV